MDYAVAFCSHVVDSTHTHTRAHAHTHTHTHYTPTLQAKQHPGHSPAPSEQQKTLLIPDEAEEDTSDSDEGDPPISRPPGGEPPLSDPHRGSRRGRGRMSPHSVQEMINYGMLYSRTSLRSDTLMNCYS